jgi:hypothetical protein
LAINPTVRTDGIKALLIARPDNGSARVLSPLRS